MHGQSFYRASKGRCYTTTAFELKTIEDFLSKTAGFTQQLP